ncbi:Eukaryotic translation initiation factor 4E-1 [Porphyridium purpureum]|uniref:Eukaryotic translation initiation factor 4E-1 n=1 Tax=Porphyridium purpureum TaxID=35688 RepID=A0A5J4Z0G3_PORPP|nr:Eukaryotic translation initiation factor 4E-1 [Porphyridium purpureum]|eukprot:POR7649..scf208_2
MMEGNGKDGVDANGEAPAPNLPESGLTSLASQSPLQFKWTFWYDGPAKVKNTQTWGQNVRVVTTFDTLEKMWCVVNNVIMPSQLEPNSSFLLFKEGIKPEWEDPKNADGGRWILNLTKSEHKKLDDYYIRSVLFIVGDNFSPDCSDDLSGLVLKVRHGRKDNFLALWTQTSSDVDLVKRIGREWKAHLNLSFFIDFELNKESMAQAHGKKDKQQYATV